MLYTSCILAIESSCDDTSVAVIRGRHVLSNVVANQTVHENYGGVVPELASRAHAQNIVPTVATALKEAGVSPEDLDAVAYTQGPGLMGSLHVGVAFAKAWAYALGKPTIPVHHMHAHILAHFLEPGDPPQLPFLCLTVSGGHTQLVRVNGPLDLQVIGTTLDDAAGEAFDKMAKLMGLPYPGGPEIDRLAAEGDPLAFAFTRPVVKGLDMSFSGLKTQILHFLQREMQSNPRFVDQRKADIAASIQHAILGILMSKLESAVASTGIQEVAIAGGVSANRGLRSELEKRRDELNWTIHIPPLSFCTDNAAMIAMTGAIQFEAGFSGSITDAPNPRLPF
jgi:N6-L-threonylcarbamoyladenine synthase